MCLCCVLHLFHSWKMKNGSECELYFGRIEEVLYSEMWRLK